MSTLIFFDYLNFQIVKVNAFDEIILGKSYFAVSFEIGNGFVQPDWSSQVKLEADFIQRPKYFVGAGIFAAVADAGILQQVIVLKGSCP